MKLLKVLGLIAPGLGAAVVLTYRRRAPGTAALAVPGCALAGAGTVAGLVATRAVFVGGGGTEGVTLAVEALQFGLLGLGILLMCLASVTSRRAEDTRAEPDDLARQVASVAWSTYGDSRRRR